jgi:hypothetical protein
MADDQSPFDAATEEALARLRAVLSGEEEGNGEPPTPALPVTEHWQVRAALEHGGVMVFGVQGWDEAEAAHAARAVLHASPWTGMVLVPIVPPEARPRPEEAPGA